MDYLVGLEQFEWEVRDSPTDCLVSYVFVNKYTDQHFYLLRVDKVFFVGPASIIHLVSTTDPRPICGWRLDDNSSVYTVHTLLDAITCVTCTPSLFSFKNRDLLRAWTLPEGYI